MDFEWDEAKRASVLRLRGIDFRDIAAHPFDGRPIVTAPSPRGGEERFVTIGMIGDRGYAAVWMWRGAAIRIVTARRARREEERQYRAIFGPRA